MNEARPQSRRILALALLCLALAGGLYLELTLPIVPTKPLVATNYGPAATRPDPTFVMPPREAYAEVVTRPLFSPTRRPVLTVAPGKLSDYRLTGTIMSAQGRYALLARRSPAKIERVAQGQTFQGWLIKMIDTDRVVLERDGNLTEISYAASADAAPQQPGATAPATATASATAQVPAEESKPELPTEAGVTVAPAPPAQVTDNASAGMFRYQVPVQPTLNGGD